MKNEEVRGQAMVSRVSDFAAAEAASFPSTSIAGQLFAEIKAALKELEDHVAGQVAGDNTAREGTEQKALANEALRDMLNMLRRTARSLDHANPGVHAKFRVPPHLSTPELLGVAETQAAEATPLKADFIAYGMPATFLEDLNELIAEIREQLAAQEKGTRERVTATASISDTLEKAFAAVRRVDPIVRNVLHDQPAKLAAWASARHIERAPKRPKPAAAKKDSEAPDSQK
jgi:hypothetical protein